MTQAVLKKWITDTLKNDSAYQVLCVDTVGVELNFYRSAPVNEIAESLPFLTVFGDTYDNDDMSSSPWNETWSIPMAIGIQAEEDSVDDAGVKTWESTDKVELIAIAARDILKKEAAGCGIKGESINLLRTEMIITEIGEADDVQASMFLTFGKHNGI